MPGAGFAMIEAEIALGALETFLDRPAQAGDACEFRKRRPFGREDQIVGLLVALCEAAADQEPAFEALLRRPGEGHPRPVGELEALRALAGGKPHKTFGGKIGGQAGRGGVDEPKPLRPSAHRLVRADRQRIGLAARLQHLTQAGIDAIERVRQNPSAGDARIERRGDEIARHLDLGGEADRFGHIGRRPALLVIRPAFRKVEPPVDQRLSEPARIGEKHPDLRVLNPAGRSRILPRRANRMLALLHKARLVDHQNPVRVAKRRKRIIAHPIAKRLRRPLASPKQRLHAIGPLEPRRLGHQPAGLALNPGKQPVDEQSRRPPQLHPRKHRTHLILKPPQLRFPRQQRSRPIRNHHPSLQNRKPNNHSENEPATVVIACFLIFVNQLLALIALAVE